MNPGTRQQICWFHKSGKGRPRSLEKARGAYDQFCEAWATKYPKAVRLPAQRMSSRCSGSMPFRRPTGVQLRTSNPIESTYATVRLRRTKGCEMRVADGDSDDGVAEKTWRRLMGMTALATYPSRFPVLPCPQHS